MEARGEDSVKKKIGFPESRAHAFYSGRVQGIGFRYTAERLALEEGLVGWVKNLPDGRVELVCEGSRRKAEELLERIRQSALGPHIRGATVAWEKPTGEFSEFRVEFEL